MTTNLATEVYKVKICYLDSSGLPVVEVKEYCSPRKGAENDAVEYVKQKYRSLNLLSYQWSIMKPVEQLVLHNPEAGLFGDCFRATLASLMEMDIEDVPHFMHDGDPNMEFPIRLNSWLGQRGLCWIEHTAHGWDFDKWLAESGIQTLYHEISDQSPRFPDLFHSVVGLNGKVVHDPHPDKKGLPIVTDKRTFSFLIKLCNGPI